jgi:hypothetical protein
MHDPAIYRRYAKECQRLAMTMPEEHRKTLLEIAEAWIKLAQESERQQSNGRDP